MPQVVIYPKEVQQLTGNGYEASKRLLQRIRARFGKDARAYVSVREFCQYTGLAEQEVSAALQAA
jgi:glucose-6-phosphate-specific signal transduction histidine kinase